MITTMAYKSVTLCCPHMIFKGTYIFPVSGRQYSVVTSVRGLSSQTGWMDTPTPSLISFLNQEDVEMCFISLGLSFFNYKMRIRYARICRPRHYPHFGPDNLRREELPSVLQAVHQYPCPEHTPGQQLLL